MNTNPYPAGRWTTRGAKARRGVRIRSESVATLRQAPLRELFWAAEESGLVQDACLRIEAALANALAAPAVLVVESVESIESDAAEPRAALQAA